MFEFTPTTAGFRLTPAGGGPPLLEAAPVWTFDGAEFSADSPLVKAEPLADELGLRFTGPGFTSSLKLSVEDCSPDRRVLLSFDFTNTGDRELRLEQLVPFRADYRRGRGLGLVGNSLRRLQESLEDVWILTDDWERVNDWNIVCEPLRGETEYLSPWDVALYNKKMNLGLFAAVAGAPKALTAFRVFWGRHEGRIEFEARADCRVGSYGVRLAPGKTFSLETLSLTVFSGPPYEAVERCTARLGNDVGARIGKQTSIQNGEETNAASSAAAPERITGYCDWYWSYGDIDQARMDANRRFLADHFPDKIQVFQLDDGWQWVHHKGTKRSPKCNGGPWVVNERFSGGMGRFARMAVADGFVPGVWMRPFSLDPTSEIGRAHPEWYPSTRAADDDPGWWGQGYRLDISNQETLAYLADFINRAVKHWGMRYLKLDFLTIDVFGTSCWGKRSLENPLGGFRDETKTGVEIYSRALATIREAAGEDCFILGCNTLTLPSAPFCDGQRTGNDVSVYDWNKTVRECLCPLFLRAHHHNRLYAADPDCVVVRDPLSIPQARLWAGAVALSGQMFLLSENLPELPPARAAIIEELSALLDQFPREAKPLDVFDDPFPRLLFASPDFLGVFNYLDEEYECLVPLEKLGLPLSAKVEAEDCWSVIRRPLSEPTPKPKIRSKGGFLHIHQAPCSSRILKLNVL